jgi:hypothetical protein
MQPTDLRTFGILYLAIFAAAGTAHSQVINKGTADTVATKGPVHALAGSVDLNASSRNRVGAF